MGLIYRYYSDAKAIADKNYDPNNERIHVFNKTGNHEYNIACIEIGGSIRGRESVANEIMEHFAGLKRCKNCGAFHAETGCGESAW